MFVVLHELPEADHEVVEERRLELLQLVLQVDDDGDDELDVALLDDLRTRMGISSVGVRKSLFV